MKSQMLTICLLIIGGLLFQPTHQYRISKRELTEYDLTSFIVGTCSINKNDMLIQNLCDQTLQAALMGNFPFLTYYCKTFGIGMNYCNSINRYMIINQNHEAKRRFVYGRFARSLNEDNKLDRKGQEMNIENDLVSKIIIRRCIVKTEKSSANINQFCNRTLQEIQLGRYPEIKHLCMYYPSSYYCQHVRSYSLLYSWPLSKPSSPLSLSSSAHSVIPNINPSFVSSSIFKPSDISSIVDQQRINKQQQQQQQQLSSS